MLRIIIASLTVLLTLWLYSPYLITYILLPLNSIEKSDLGDIYTAVTALFSTLAFGALLLTIFIQNKQLRLQKKELLKSEAAHDFNAKLSAYSALLNYYESNAYDPEACKLSPRNIAMKLDEIINKTEETPNK